MSFNDPPRERKSWFASNWLWAIPVGCLGLCLLCVGSCFGLGLCGLNKVGNNWAVVQGYARAQENPQVIAALGSPLKKGMARSVNYHIGPVGDTTGIGWNLSMEIPLTGPNGTAVLYVKARERGAKRIYQQLELRIDGRDEAIDLRTDAERQEAAAATPAPPEPPAEPPPTAAENEKAGRNPAS